jgi:hypothetical protein
MTGTAVTPPAAQQSAPRPIGLRVTWAIAFGSLLLAFPVYSIAALGFGMDRRAVADALALHVTLAYWIGIFAALLPFPALRDWTRFQRLQAVALPFVIVSYATHLSWELIWLIAHKAIAHSRNSIWAYPWWAYIDGGDVRYLNPHPSFLMIEVLSVINASVGVTGLIMLKRSKFADYRGTLLVMSTAVTHTVMTWYYYGTEIVGGFPSVNTSSFMDLWVKFIFLNAPWLVGPWFVIAWGYQLLKRQFAAAPASENATALRN